MTIADDDILVLAASEYYRRQMHAAIAQYEAATQTWKVVTDAYRKPGREEAVAIGRARSDPRRIEAGLNQQFFAQQAVMYGIAAIAEQMREPQ
jgi:hypothetical protein